MDKNLKYALAFSNLDPVTKDKLGCKEQTHGMFVNKKLIKSFIYDKFLGRDLKGSTMDRCIMKNKLNNPNIKFIILNETNEQKIKIIEYCKSYLND